MTGSLVFRVLMMLAACRCVCQPATLRGMSLTPDDLAAISHMLDAKLTPIIEALDAQESRIDGLSAQINALYEQRQEDHRILVALQENAVISRVMIESHELKIAGLEGFRSKVRSAALLLQDAAA